MNENSRCQMGTKIKLTALPLSFCLSIFYISPLPPPPPPPPPSLSLSLSLLIDKRKVFTHSQLPTRNLYSSRVHKKGLSSVRRGPTRISLFTDEWMLRERWNHNRSSPFRVHVEIELQTHPLSVWGPLPHLHLDIELALHKGNQVLTRITYQIA